MEYRASLEALSASTINVRLSAIRKMVSEARSNGMVGSGEAASLSEIPDVRQKGTRLGNRLTREQARELLAVPDRSTLQGKRDFAILALLVGCGLRRQELASLDVETIQLREGRWVLADLEGKGRRVRTVAVPIWVKHGINAWMTAGEVEDGRLLRSITKGGKVGKSLSDWSVWSVVEQLAKQIGSRTSEPMTSGALARSFVERAAGIQSRSSSSWAAHPFRRRNHISEQEIAVAVNDSLGSVIRAKRTL